MTERSAGMAPSPWIQRACASCMRAEGRSGARKAAERARVSASPATASESRARAAGSRLQAPSSMATRRARSTRSSSEPAGAVHAVSSRLRAGATSALAGAAAAAPVPSPAVAAACAAAGACACAPAGAPPRPRANVSPATAANAPNRLTRLLPQPSAAPSVSAIGAGG